MQETHEPASARWYGFGPFVVDPSAHLLWRNGTLVPLPYRSFEILLILIEHRGRVVDKSQLFERIWPNVAVEENTLTRHVSTLRKALDEPAGHYQHVLTVPGRGYRFVTEVTEYDQRPDTLREPSLTDVAAHASDMASAALPFAASRRRRYALMAAVVVGVAVLVATVVRNLVLDRGPGPKPAAQGTTAPPRPFRQVTFLEGLQRQPTLSPDGKSLAYASDRGGHGRIWVQSLDEPDGVALTEPELEASQPAWSRDGQWIAFRSESASGGLYVIPARGGRARRVASFGCRPQWSPDGSLILFTTSDRKSGPGTLEYVVGLNGESPRLVRPDVLGGVRSRFVAWAPARRAISVSGEDRRTGEWTFLTVPVDDGAPAVAAISKSIRERLANEGLMLGQFFWSPSGSHLFFQGRQGETDSIWRITVDPKMLALIGGPDRLTTSKGSDTDISVSADGSRLVFSSQTTLTRLWMFPFDSESAHVSGPGTPVTSGVGVEQGADAPLDGGKLVYSAVRGNRRELWERSVADGRERLLISGTDWTRSTPLWSPDATRVVYVRSRGTRSAGRSDARVAMLPTDGGEEEMLTSAGDPEVTPSDWSRDGRSLLVSCHPGGADTSTAACVLPIIEDRLAASRGRVVAADNSYNVFQARFSPNQRWVSFVAVSRVDPTKISVFVVPAAGGAWVPVTDGVLPYGDKPRWAPDGRALFFISTRDGLLNVWGRHVDPSSGTPFGPPFQVTTFTSPRRMLTSQVPTMQVVVSRDRIFVPVTEITGQVWMLENVDH